MTNNITRSQESSLGRQKQSKSSQVFEGRQTLIKEKMAKSEDMQEAIMQIARQSNMVAVGTVMEVDLTTELHTRRNIPKESHRPKEAGPMQSQPAFEWKVPDRYVELLNFKMEVANILQTKGYDLNYKEKVPIIKKLDMPRGLHFIQTLMNAEKDTCDSATGLFNVLKEKFRPQHNEMILSIQYCKLYRKVYESAEEWMGKLCIRATEYNYTEHDRKLKEQFINGIDNEEITKKIIKELMVQNNTQEIDTQ